MSTSVRKKQLLLCAAREQYTLVMPNHTKTRPWTSVVDQEIEDGGEKTCCQLLSGSKQEKGSRTPFNPFFWFNARVLPVVLHHSVQKGALHKVKILFLWINLSVYQKHKWWNDYISIVCTLWAKTEDGLCIWVEKKLHSLQCDRYVGKKKCIHEAIIIIYSFLFLCRPVSLMQALMWGQSFPFSKINVFVFASFFFFTNQAAVTSGR